MRGCEGLLTMPLFITKRIDIMQFISFVRETECFKVFNSKFIANFEHSFYFIIY